MFVRFRYPKINHKTQNINVHQLWSWSLLIQTSIHSSLTLFTAHCPESERLQTPWSLHHSHLLPSTWETHPHLMLSGRRGVAFSSAQQYCFIFNIYLFLILHCQNSWYFRLQSTATCQWKQRWCSKMSECCVQAQIHLSPQQLHLLIQIWSLPTPKNPRWWLWFLPNYCLWNSSLHPPEWHHCVYAHLLYTVYRWLMFLIPQWLRHSGHEKDVHVITAFCV